MACAVITAIPKHISDRHRDVALTEGGGRGGTVRRRLVDGDGTVVGQWGVSIRSASEQRAARSGDRDALHLDLPGRTAETADDERARRPMCAQYRRAGRSSDRLHVHQGWWPYSAMRV